MAREDGLLIDTAGFEQALGEQKERSREDRRSKSISVSGAGAVAISDLSNVFSGYDTLDSDATITAIVKDGAPVEEVGVGEEAQVFFDVTPFYAEKGGQVSDDGIVEQGSSVASVGGVTVVRDNLSSHALKVEKGSSKRAGAPTLP